VSLRHNITKLQDFWEIYREKAGVFDKLPTNSTFVKRNERGILCNISCMNPISTFVILVKIRTLHVECHSTYQSSFEWQEMRDSSNQVSWVRPTGRARVTAVPGCTHTERLYEDSFCCGCLEKSVHFAKSVQSKKWNRSYMLAPQIIANLLHVPTILV
jgi:hypothetical protein